MRKIWKMKVKVVPLGTTTIKLRNWSKEIGIKTQMIELQKTLLLHNAQILQKVFEV